MALWFRLIFLFHAVLHVLCDLSEEKKNNTFDYLLFTQVWPYSVCDVANLAHNDSCSVPQVVTSGWTIHGLWPSRHSGGMGPNFCIPADHFDLEKVKPLVPELMHHWPNLIPDEPLYSLWQHEWIKHGTCAEQLASISGEMKYFGYGLQLNEMYSIKNILSHGGIEPSDEAKFKAADVANAMEKEKGKKVEVHCLKATQGKWYLVDIRVCLDMELNQMDCPEHKEMLGEHKSELLEGLGLPNVQQCPPNELLYYPPPRPDHYHSDEQHEMHSYAHDYQQEYGDTFHSHQHDHNDHQEL